MVSREQVGRLRPGTLIFELEPGMVQVGSNPDHAITLSGLDAHEVAWLQTMSQGRGNLPLPPRYRTLLGRLGQAGLLATPSPLAPLRVQVHGLDRVGVRLMRLLAGAGVRALEVRDRRPVDDHVANLFPPHSLGVSRQKAAREALRQCCPDLPLGSLDHPDLVVVSSARTWDHGTLAQMLSSDITHLPVVQDDRAVTIGPLIAPGITACAVCIDKHTNDLVPGWSQMGLDLAALDPAVTPDHLSTAAAGMTLAMVQALVSGKPLGSQDKPLGTPGAPTLSWRLSETGLQTQEWHPHPACGCGAYSRTVPGVSPLAG